VRTGLQGCDDTTDEQNNEDPPCPDETGSYTQTDVVKSSHEELLMI
jgi:hypothetical protein